jgi:uncharacterized membrane protein YgcG
MTTRRRKLSMIGIIALSLIAPIAVFIGARVFDGERITNYWTAVEISSTSSDAVITEVIDYDFGQSSRRGILRRVPDLDPAKGVMVSSATAPDQVQVGFGAAPTVRIGDPDQTIRGRHRYELKYSLDTLISGDQFSWNAVGTEWQVSISKAEIHIISTSELFNVRCDKGRFGSFGGCSAEEIEPGYLVVKTGRLARGEGVTVSADIGNELARPPVSPDSPPSQQLSSGMPLVIAMVIAFGGTLAASPVVGRLVRARGREQIRHTTAAMLGFIDDVESIDSYRLADESEMARLIYPTLDPPRGISAPQGGIIVSERVTPEHKVAWLLEAAALGEVELEDVGDKELILRRGPATPRPTSARRIESLFTKGDEVVLGEYDSGFASSWSGLEEDLEQWKERSGFWDSSGDRRRAVALIGGSFVVALSAVLVAVTGGIAMRWSPAWLPLLVLASLVLGSALTVVIRSWELRVRTPEGTSKWIEVEALRRFLSELEPESALNMIEPDRFAGYTAWAIAFGFDEQWKEIIAALRMDPRFQHVPVHHFHLASIGPSVSRATSSASTAPSSSSGGGGGGVGGGGGGGGGGSW